MRFFYLHTLDRLGVGGISKIFTSRFDCGHLCKLKQNDNEHERSEEGALQEQGDGKVQSLHVGNLYYTVDLSDGTYQFPIATVEQVKVLDDSTVLPFIKLSGDLGTTSFCAEVKGSDLNRWTQRRWRREILLR